MMHYTKEINYYIVNFTLECSNGYFGNECSTKCIYPNYGEDCQYYCQCGKTKCHFSDGCTKKMATFNQYQIPSM